MTENTETKNTETEDATGTPECCAPGRAAFLQTQPPAHSDPK
jgi:hypothetical protein